MQLFVYILYVFCTQIVYIVLMMHTFCRSELMYTKCIQDAYKMYPIFQQTFVYILYINFNCHSSFNLKCIQKFVEMVGYILHTSCIHFVYIHQLQPYILYNFCTQNVHKISIRETICKKQKLCSNPKYDPTRALSVDYVGNMWTIFALVKSSCRSTNLRNKRYFKSFF